MAENIETRNAIIYGLLAQEKPLTNDEMKSLQTQLKAEGIDTGKVDGLMGKNTAGAIGEFLRSPKHREFIDQLSNKMKSDLNHLGQKKLIDRLAHQNDLKNIGTINLSALESGDLSRTSVAELQKSLNKIGHDTGGTRGIFGPKTAESIVEYLGDNIGAIETIDPKILLMVMKKGQTSELKELMNKPDPNGLIDHRIRDALESIGDLETTTDYEAVYKLQTLLTLGGHQHGGIDGIVGSKTLSAVDRYIASQSPEAIIPSQKPKISTPTAQEFKLSTGSLADTSQYSNPMNGGNGYGVSNLHIEKAWAKVTATHADDGILSSDSNDAISLVGNPRPLVVIDLGHGSDIDSNNVIDHGAVSKHNGLSETDVIEPVGQSLAKQLREKGYDVAFTRNVGEQLRLEGSHSDTLKVRSDFSNQLAAEAGANGVLFVSLHANAFSNPSVSGSRIYHDIDGSNQLNSNSLSLAEKIANTYSINGRTSAVKHVANLTVLDRAEDFAATSSSAATLIELGFLSNKDDAQKLREMSESPEIAAKQIAEGINNHVLSVTPELRNIIEHTEPAPAPLPH